MGIDRPSTRESPAELRRQIANQLRIDSWQLARVTADGLYRLRDLLAVDELTGVLRRKAGLAALGREIERARRYGKQRLVLAFLDVDNLKSINDNQGHAAGDAALIQVAGLLRGRLRKHDVIFRNGGDEFVCVLTNAGIEVAQTLMQEVWEQLQQQRGPSFSVGFADLRDEDNSQTLIARADECLYLSKRSRYVGPTVMSSNPSGLPFGTRALRDKRGGLVVQSRHATERSG